MGFYLLQYYGRDDSWTWFQIALVVLIIFSLISMARSSNQNASVLSHWHHRFEIPPFSPQEFYEAMATSILSKEMDKLKISRVEYLQGGFLSPKRDYLRIQYKEYAFDICAAPFGKGYFVSWWFVEHMPFRQLFFKNFPIFGLLTTRSKKTYFELDTEAMFKDSVSACVKEVIEQLTENKGIRALSEADWEKQYNRSFQQVPA